MVDSNSDEFAIGDRVAALTFTGGCYAQYVAVDTKMLAKVPENVTLEQAGALPCIGQTALQFVDFADIQAGEHVVINAPAGGVGHLLIQLLMLKVATNNIKVTVICSPEKYAKLGELIDTDKLAGWIDYTKDEAFPDLQADVLLDLVGDEAGVHALSVLKSGARVNVLPTIWVDKLKEAGKEIYEWLEEGAIFYVCGDAERMAKDVDSTLHEIIEEHGGKTPEEAIEYMAQLKKDKRYRRDVY